MIEAVAKTLEAAKFLKASKVVEAAVVLVLGSGGGIGGRRNMVKLSFNM